MKQKVIFALSVAAAAFLFFGAGRGGGDTPSADARKLVSEGALLLDVRTGLEFSAGHLDGAVNIPVQELEAKLAEVPAKKDQAIVVYCRSGKRSATAKQMLEKAGFTKVHDLGGMGNW